MYLVLLFLVFTRVFLASLFGLEMIYRYAFSAYFYKYEKYINFRISSFLGPMIAGVFDFYIFDGNRFFFTETVEKLLSHLSDFLLIGLFEGNCYIRKIFKPSAK